MTTTVYIEKLSHDGRGIARIDGKTTFIDGALEGEQVTFEYTRKKRDFDEGRVLTIETASPDRVEPRCPHHGMCGGCSLQHLRESVQIHEKEKLVLDVLTRIGHVVPEEISPVLASKDAWNYRSRARLSVNVVPKKNRVLVGFREKRNPRYVADIKQCSILHKEVGDKLLDLSELIGAMNNPRAFPQIEVSAGDDVVALVFRHLEALTDADKERFCLFSDDTGFQIFLQPAGLDSIQLFYPEGQSALSYRLPDQDVTFSFYPTDFTQVNARLNRAMVTQAIDWLALKSDDVVLDLFCGLGNFSLPLARLSARVIGVEGGEAMVVRAQKNAIQNKIENAVFSCANLDDENALSALKTYECNKLLLDPPRTGALEIVKNIEKIGPSDILYVSCNPATFARDASVLVNEKGYRLIKVGVMDMFPHTTHVEVMGLFRKG
ncbi:MAG: 23S rRNA (uracil(1939)-C(5))-methyltransferase RlmD [Gammaproteobacteria bacterium]|nr:23S rRNA (uracil(1939)-C(5))-methyltransferase RlmD [Gammaproteobacteria bacterium]